MDDETEGPARSALGVFGSGAPVCAKGRRPGQSKYIIIENTCFALSARRIGVHRQRKDRDEGPQERACHVPLDAQWRMGVIAASCRVRKGMGEGGGVACEMAGQLSSVIAQEVLLSTMPQRASRPLMQTVSPC